MALQSFVTRSPFSWPKTPDWDPIDPGLVTTGWTVFSPTTTGTYTTRVVYVSDSVGLDSNDGLSADPEGPGQGPKKTIFAGAQLIRNGYPDWLLLRRGDTFTNQNFNSFNGNRWDRSGRSASQPMLISSYGSAVARPIVATNNQPGLINGAKIVRFLAIVGIDFYCSNRPLNTSGPGGIYTTSWNGDSTYGPVEDWLVEDCRFREFCNGMSFTSYQAGMIQRRIKIRRCQIIDSWEGNATNLSGGNGMFIGQVDDLLIEESLFDNNGWQAAHSHHSHSYYGHNIYLYEDRMTNVVTRGNIIATSGMVQQRCGGILVNNLALKCPVGFQIGGGQTPDPAGLLGTCKGNVVLDGNNFPPPWDQPDNQFGSNYGIGIETTNLHDSVVSYNVVAHNSSGTGCRAFLLGTGGDTGGVGLVNVTFTHNIAYQWGSNSSTGFGPGGVIVSPYSFQPLINFIFTDNDVQNPAGTAFDTGYLMYPRSGTTDFMSGIHSAGNRFWRNGTDENTTTLFRNGQTEQNRSLVQLKTDFSGLGGAPNDTTSTHVLVSYPDATRTIGSYEGTLGGTATLAGFLAVVRAMHRMNWDKRHIPTYGTANVPAGGAYAAGVEVDGPLKYIRDGFGMPYPLP